MHLALLASVFVVASCGLIYELIAGALSSYLLGDSVTQFSTVIGCYLFAMGIGSWLSRMIDKNLAQRFIQIELAVGMLGGFSAMILFIVFSVPGAPFHLALYTLVFLIGTLVGLEIPLVMRLLEKETTLKDLVSQVLAVDYLGALVVSILFPLLLAPSLGFVRTGLLFGILNSIVALWAIHLFRNQLPYPKFLAGQTMAVVGLLAVGMVGANHFTAWVEHRLYQDEIVHSQSSPYQRIVITRWRSDLRLFLNGNLQFSSRDEYRYHEALVHPALASHPRPARVLVLGGGDGLAVREILKYPSVKEIVLVDLDPSMTTLFRTHPMLTDLNHNSLSNPKVKVINTDGFQWLENDTTMWDVAIVDFPDPSNYAVGKLYTSSFYHLLARRLATGGVAVVQSTSPYYARGSFWTIATTIEDVGFKIRPYHVMVPSFGEWGYVLLTHGSWNPPTRFPEGLRFINVASMPSLFQFPPDMDRVPARVNRLNNQELVRQFEEEWGKYSP